MAAQPYGLANTAAINQDALRELCAN